MSAEQFSDWILRSFLTGALAVVLMHLCPASWRGRFRLVVPVAASCALILLAGWLVRPIPRLEIATPAALSGIHVAWHPGMWVGLLWSAGVFACILRQLHGVWSIRQILRDSQPIPGNDWDALMEDCKKAIGIRGTVELRFAGRRFIPSATGLWRRVVLLPEEAAHWAQARRRLVLLHELGHFRRGDLWTDALGRLACALHWFNPFAWLLHRRLAVEREYACDALVLDRGAPPSDYAMLLWEMATATQQRPASSAVSIAMASAKMSKLEQRVRRILCWGPKPGHWMKWADASLCGVLAVTLLACTACKPATRLLADAALPFPGAEIRLRLAADPFPGN